MRPPRMSHEALAFVGHGLGGTSGDAPAKAGGDQAFRDYNTLVLARMALVVPMTSPRQRFFQEVIDQTGYR